jgi:hypothetical protein
LIAAILWYRFPPLLNFFDALWISPEVFRVLERGERESLAPCLRGKQRLLVDQQKTIREGEIYGVSCDTPQLILIGRERGDHKLPYFPPCVNICAKNYTSYI